MTAAIEASRGGVVVHVKASPGARRSGITAVRGGVLCVSTTAAPDKGKANEAIIEILAKAFGVPKQNVSIVRGATNRRKDIHVAGIAADMANQLLSGRLDGAGE